MSQINFRLLLKVLFTCGMILYTTVSEKTVLSGEASNDAKKEFFGDKWSETDSNKDCLCGKNEKCEFEDGVKICTCIDGYAKNNDSECEACNCGEKSFGCSFKDGVKFCNCTFQHGDKDGVCEACNCGEESYSCSFKDGVKKCACNFKHGDKDGVCIACNCGEKSFMCSFKDEVKNCDCFSQYGDNNGVCEACNCGENYTFCSFKDGAKTCDCNFRYFQRDGVCEACNCGEESGGCSLKDGVKFCQCLAHYADNKGVCEACNCGNSSLGCSFKDGVKFCDCDNFYADNEGICEACNCGYAELGCYFKDGTKTCKCREGYADKKGSCEKLPCEKECKNGGSCQKEKEKSFCVCIAGTSGDLCENIDECQKDKSFCKAREGTECYFNVKQKKAACKCIDGDLKFDERSKRCRKTCENTDKGKKCQNYGSCELSGGTDNFCVCKEGTSGDYCETIANCSDLDCGADATCTYAVGKGAYCKCDDENVAFNLVDKCSDVDGCLLKKRNNECNKKNEICEKGKCRCEDAYEYTENEKECKIKASAANSKTGAIVGGVLGTLIVIILVVAAFIIYRKNNQRRALSDLGQSRR